MGGGLEIPITLPFDFDGLKLGTADALEQTNLLQVLLNLFLQPSRIRQRPCSMGSAHTGQLFFFHSSISTRKSEWESTGNVLTTFWDSDGNGWETFLVWTHCLNDLFL